MTRHGDRLVFELHVPSLASVRSRSPRVVLRSTSVGEQIAHEVRVPLVVNPRLDR